MPPNCTGKMAINTERWQQGHQADNGRDAASFEPIEQKEIWKITREDKASARGCPKTSASTSRWRKIAKGEGEIRKSTLGKRGILEDQINNQLAETRRS